MTWVRIAYQLPPQNEIVLTKIDDQGGVRNEQELKLIGKLWFAGPDYKTYVYYTPTHWKRK